MEYLITPYAQSMEPFAWWDGAFTEEELDWLQNKAKSAVDSAQVGGDGAVHKEIRRSQINWVHNTPETEWIYARLAHVASSLNSQFFQFDLSGFGDALQFTNYDQSENGMYGWHQDYGVVISRKLSLVVQLSDPSEYEGGNLEIKTGMTPMVVKKKRGLIAAFPSYVLHQVTPVTRGNRQSLVSWVSGPRFR